MTAVLILMALLICAQSATLWRHQIRIAELHGDYQCLRKVVVNVADRLNDAIKQANVLRSDFDTARETFAASGEIDKEAIDQAVRRGVIDVLRPVSHALKAALEPAEQEADRG